MSVPSSDAAAVRRIVRHMKSKGAVLSAIDDGGDDTYRTVDWTEKQILDAAMAVDCSWLTWTRGEESMTVFFVFGNSPEEVVCDYNAIDSTLAEDLEEVLDSFES